MEQIKMSSKPILTIGIPTYNGSKTIRNMLDILLPQCDSRVEVFVSDNCSTDSTPEIIRQYQKTYNNVTYSKNETNIGTDRNIIKCFEKSDK